MTDNAQPTNGIASPQSKVKLKQSERFLCGAFLGLNATVLCGLLMIEPIFRSPILFACLIPTASISGYFILPLFLSKNIRSGPYSFLGGCLASALTWLLSYSIYIAVQIYLLTDWGDSLEGFVWILYFTGALAVVVSPFVDLLTILLDRALFRHRQKHAPIDSRIFE